MKGAQSQEKGAFRERPRRDSGSGAAKLIVGLLLIFAASYGYQSAGLQPDDALPAGLALAALAAALAVFYWFYRGVRQLTGLGVVLSLIVASFLPAVPVILADALPKADFSIAGEKLAGLGLNHDPGGDNRPQDSEGGDYFTGLDAGNTDAAALDALIEDW